MATSEAEPLFPGMAKAEVVGELDALYIVLTLLCLLHAVAKRGLVSGIAITAFLAVHTAAFEHISLFLGGTHCHASSASLPMVTPCSSINSVLFYVPWTYTSIEAARRLDLHPAALPFAVGLLQIGFGAVYEMQGPSNRFWKWPDDAGVIASSPLLKAWDGYPPFTAEVQQKREVASIVNGVFRVSHHAGGALAERLFEFPLLAPYFHFAFGFGWATSLLVTGAVDSRAPPSMLRFLIAGVLVLGLFLPPIWITRGLTEAAGLPLIHGVPISLALSTLPLLLFGRKKLKKASTATKPSADALLFLISLGMHAFMVSFAWGRAPTPAPSGLIGLVTVTATLHLIAQMYCCFGKGGGGAGGKQKKK